MKCDEVAPGYPSYPPSPFLVIRQFSSLIDRWKNLWILAKAYALVGDDGRDSFGREALDTLIKLVEDQGWLPVIPVVQLENGRR